LEIKSGTKRLIIAIVFFQVALTVAIFALPRAVEALPGEYYVRLQNHPLTAGVMELVTTPLPAALPVAADVSSQAAPASLPEIPGLEDATLATATFTPEPAATETAIEEAAGGDSGAAATPLPSATPEPSPSPTVEPLPEQASLEGLSVVKQGFNNCGPANLTIILNFWGNETTQEEAAAYLKPNREDRNVSPWQIEEYVNDFTELRALARSGGELEMVKRFIAAGIPVVIEKGYEPNSTEGWYGHYLTVYGYDDSRQEIYTRDTNSGPFDGSPRSDSYDDFQYWWQQFNYTFYVVYRPEQEGLVHSIIPGQLLDDRSMWEYTTQVATQEVSADPGNVFALFNLGVSQTRLGELTGEAAYYERGAVAFDQARAIGLPPRTLYYEHRPFMAYWKIGRLADVLELADALLATTGGRFVEEIYWFQGHALAGQGNLAGARDAYVSALEVNSNFHPAQQSLDWVNSLLGG